MDINDFTLKKHTMGYQENNSYLQALRLQDRQSKKKGKYSFLKRNLKKSTLTSKTLTVASFYKDGISAQDT